MSEILTRIMIPGCHGSGLSEWGRKSVSEMVKSAREYGALLKKHGEELLNAKDSEFQIDIVRGSIVQHHVKELQRSSLKS